jgi:prepilin-type N-terminal cleavage/methylation domain-containing protein
MRCRGHNTEHSVRQGGFTVAELLIALMVMSIVLGAVGTLAYAVGRACESTDSLNTSQGELRYAALRITECLRHAKMAVVVSTKETAVWTADADNDNYIDPNELVYIEAVTVSGTIERLQMVDFCSSSQPVEHVVLADIQSGAARSSLVGRVTRLADNCTDTSFQLIPPKLVNITFGIVENGYGTKYQISAKLTANADNLLDGSGGMVISDDD